MGVAYADADGIDEGEFAVMFEGWQKLPYPKFLENVLCGLWCCNVIRTYYSYVNKNVMIAPFVAHSEIHDYE